MLALWQFMKCAPSWAQSTSIGSAAGLFAHYGFFIRGEWHVQAPDLVVFHLCLCILVLACCTYGDILGFTLSLRNGFLICFSYCASLFLSIAIYRFSFHRLSYSQFPGPLYARITKLWHVWAARDSKNHIVLHELHEVYGEFVRTGMNYAYCGMPLTPHRTQ